MNRSKAYKTAIRGILIGIIILQSMVPMIGFLPLGVINLTIVHITVIVAAIVLGPNDGALIGLFWGLGTFIRSYVSPTSPIDTMIFTNPIISVLPRIAVGWIAGLVYKALKTKSKKVIAMGISAAIGSLVNTSAVLILMRVIYASQTAQVYKVPTSALNNVLLAVVGTNGVPEMIAAIIIVPLIASAILKSNKFLDN